MKIAVTGKGGVGKTTVAALLCAEFTGRGRPVLAVDADPDANLAEALAFPDAEKIHPIAELEDLIRERVGDGGGLVRLNPVVADIPETHSAVHNGVRLIVMGGVTRAGAGCACPANVLLKELMSHILIGSDGIVVMDMEAGIEHLGRATAGSVDCLVVVVEPSAASIGSARKIARLAADLGIPRISCLANRMQDDDEAALVESELRPLEILGSIPFSRTLRNAALRSGAARVEPELRDAVSRIADRLLG